jgi:hypothetical protein
VLASASAYSDDRKRVDDGIIELVMHFYPHPPPLLPQKVSGKRLAKSLPHPPTPSPFNGEGEQYDEQSPSPYVERGWVRSTKIIRILTRNPLRAKGSSAVWKPRS